MKNQRGITLIALVVTIVVLLILAGITITYVLSDGGIFNTAKRSANEQEKAAIRDYMTSAIYDLTVYAYAPTSYPSGTSTSGLLKAAFPYPAGVTAQDSNVVATTTGGTLSVTVSGVTVKLSESGTVYNVSYSNGNLTVTEATTP